MSSLSTRLAFGAATLTFLATLPAASMPRLMDLYNAHPRSTAANRDKCVVCHTNANGSGRLTTFGEKYEHQGLEFTASLMNEYPNLFMASGAASSSSSAVSPGGSSNPAPPSETQAPAEAAPPWTVAAYFRAECQKCHGKLGDGDPLQGVPAWATRQWLATRAPQKDELVNIILNGKDKMIGHAGKITKDQAVELYLMILEIARKNS
ncbi:MAG: cytochrome c [Vicinamibacteria bacterium]